MLYCRMRLAAALCAALLGSALLAACGAEQKAAPGGSTDSSTSVQTSRGAQPVALVIQMTGLLLLVPVQNGLEVLMPPLTGHDAFIGYKTADGTGCWRWDPVRKICYQSMEGWTLDPIGMKGGGKPATSALNLTRGSGKKINLGQAKKEMRSGLTLGPGLESETCRLAEWTYDPVGKEEGPSRVQLVNVMTWRVEDVGTNSIALRRTRVGNPAVSQPLGTLQVVDGEIQLLVMHIPNEETKAFFTLTSVEHPLVAGSGNRLHEEEPDSVRIRKHFNAFYDLMHVQQGNRPMPTDLKEKAEVCPITILGLRDVFPSQADTSSFGPRGRVRGRGGLSTYSCVMTSALPGG